MLREDRQPQPRERARDLRRHQERRALRERYHQGAERAALSRRSMSCPLGEPLVVLCAERAMLAPELHRIRPPQNEWAASVGTPAVKLLEDKVFWPCLTHACTSRLDLASLPGAVSLLLDMSQNGEPDYTDVSKTENTRVSYPIYHIDNYEPSGMGGHPNSIVFLTCDAFGVLPPVSRLSPGQVGPLAPILRRGGSRVSVSSCFVTCLGLIRTARSPLQSFLATISASLDPVFRYTPRCLVLRCHTHLFICVSGDVPLPQRLHGQGSGHGAWGDGADA